MPTRPGLWMWPGMMPILHSPGVITPGQFGPIRRTPSSSHFTFTSSMSSVGTPLGDADDQPDSAVGRLEDRVLAERRRHVDHRCVGTGGGNRVGHGVEYRQAEVGLATLAGVTPPTIFVPYSMACFECEVPCEPVKPWQMTLVSLLTRMLIELPLRCGDDGLSSLGQALCRDDVESALGQHPGTEVGIVALEAHHHGHLDAYFRHRADDALGDQVATHDAAEDVDQHRAHAWRRRG